jgi:hypothetical protein
VKTLLINSFPKTGDRVLQDAFIRMYPSVDVVKSNGTVADFSLNSNDVKIVTSLRNPEDSISRAMSTKKAFLGDIDTVEEFTAYYLRFYTAALENKDNILILDYDVFFEDFSNVDEKIKEAFGLDAEVTLTFEELQNDILNDERNIISSPSDTELNSFKQQVLSDSKYAECLSLYNQIKNML